MKKLRNKQGFTLIEVVVVMAIIAVLAILVVGAITVARNTAKETTHRSNAKTVQAGLEAYFAKNKSYPATTSTYSFNVVATNAATATPPGVGVVLAGTSECTVTAQLGGGTVLFTSSGYTITPYDSACTAAMTNDVITQ